MQEVFPERERQRAGLNAASQGGVQPVSLYGFLDGVVNDEDKTRRLGYLIRQVGFVIAVILVSAAAAGYVLMYKVPVPVKAGVGGGSTLFIILGTLAIRISRTARRRRAPGGSRSAIPSLLPRQQFENDIDSKVSRTDSSNGQDAGDANPNKDLGSASQP
jgi:hypothetical protein